jgi:hypothetical protein
MLSCWSVPTANEGKARASDFKSVGAGRVQVLRFLERTLSPARFFDCLVQDETGTAASVGSRAQNLHPDALSTVVLMAWGRVARLQHAVQHLMDSGHHEAACELAAALAQRTVGRLA